MPCFAEYVRIPLATLSSILPEAGRCNQNEISENALKSGDAEKQVRVDRVLSRTVSIQLRRGHSVNFIALQPIDI